VLVFLTKHTGDLWPYMGARESHSQRKMPDLENAMRKFRRARLVDCSISLYGTGTCMHELGIYSSLLVLRYSRIWEIQYEDEVN
jgi:hypothetical protein